MGRKSVACCGLSGLPQSTPRIERRPGAAPSANVSGVKRCGCPVCPICGPALAAKRAAILEPQLAAFEAKGWSLWLVTLTSRHGRDDELVGLLDKLGKAWTRMLSGKAGLSKALELEFIRGLDLTLGGPNGDHPHLHLVLALGPSHGDGAATVRRIFDHWKRKTRSLGIAARDAGLDARRTTSAAKAVAYVTSSQKSKTAAASPALEAVGAAVKSGHLGRTMHDLAIAYVEGEKAAGGHWKRGAVALAGRRMVTVSKGFDLKKELLEGETGDVVEREPVAELTDEGLRALDPHLGAILPVAAVSAVAGQAAIRAVLGPPGRLWRLPGAEDAGPASPHAQQAYAAAKCYA